MSVARALAAIAFLTVPAHAAEVQALILTGAATDEAAQKLLGPAKERVAALAPLLTAPQGFPRVVESATLKGLKPGFFVVVAGYCAAAEPLLTALKAADAGAYAKPVEGVGEACPTFDGAWKPTTVEAKGLRAVLFQSADEWRVFLRAGDVALDGKQHELSGCAAGGTGALKVKGGAIVLTTTDCLKPRGCPNPGLATTAVTFTLKDKEIVHDVKVLKDEGMKGCSGE